VLTEDDVVNAVCARLTGDGYEIVQRATATQRGYDVVAVKKGRKLVVEAKGAGSSKEWTKRHGSEFSSVQVFDHVAKAVLKALRVISAGTDCAGVAFPDNAAHRREIELVSTALRGAGIAVFWVNDDHEVRVDAPWKL
jgi:hypothetical protein